MSSLRSALDELRTEGLAALTDIGLATDIDEIERAFRVLEAERGRRLTEFERRRAFAKDGHLSAAAWLSDRHGVSRRSAHAATRRASALAAMPVAASALGAGELSSSALDLLASARESCPEAYEQGEEALVEAARTMPFGELCRTVDTWRIAADRERAVEDEDRAYEQRHLDVVPTVGGLVRVAGELDPDTGQSLITALRAVTDVEARSAAVDGSVARTPGQRRADALGEVCRGWLASLDRPHVGGELPHVVVTMDLHALEGRAGARHTRTRARSPRRLPVVSRATRTSRACSPTRARSRSTSAAGPRSCPRRCVEPWPCETEDAASQAAIDHPDGAMRTLGNGRTAARPPSRISSFCAGRITGRSIAASPFGWWMGNRSSRGPTDRRSRGGLHRRPDAGLP